MINKLIANIKKTNAPIVVGLDPMLNYVPEHVQKKAFAEYGETLEGAAEAVWQFNKAIVDATYDLIPAVKPQVAMYEQFGVPGMAAYEKTVSYCQEKGLVVIGDIKRGDIGSTSEAYAVGHLGHVQVGKDLLADRCQTLDEILPGVLAEVKPYEEQYGHAIPVFVAGGVYTGADMAHFTKLGAAGVQLATRFIPTYECDASQTYKDVLLAAKPEDVRIIHSPVGMPGRALNTPLVQALAEGKRFPPRHCARCLKTCDPAAVPYCITHALIEAVKGNVEEGLFFCGENVGRLDRMRTVRELMDELVTEWRQNL